MSSRILVVYFSRSGSTARVASYLADELDADLDAIEEPRSRAGIGGYVRSAFEAVAKGLPTIQTRRDPRDYDLVVLGTPVWGGTMASPVRSYIHEHNESLAKTAFFVVMGGRGGDDTVREMQMACGVGARPSCVFRQEEVEHDRDLARCEDFIQRIHGGAIGKASPARAVG